MLKVTVLVYQFYLTGTPQYMYKLDCVAFYFYFCRW